MKNLSLLKLLILICTLYTSMHAEERSLEKVSIQLKWFYQYQFAGIIMAKEKGFYERAGLDVTIKERDPKKNNILQVVEGDSEYGIADAVILRYRAEGHPLKVLATIFQHNPMVLISKKESGILSPYEIRGKKISYQEGLDDSMVSSLLAFADLDKEDFIKSPMDFSHMDFVNGDVDISEAYISIEPYWLKKKHGIEVNIIDPKNYGIDFYGDLIFTTEKEIDEHPDRVEAFKRATLEGWAYALEHQEEAIALILEKYNTRELNYDQLIYEARITKKLIAPEYIQLGLVQKERFTVLAKLYQDRGLLKEALDQAVEDIVYSKDVKSSILHTYRYQILASSFVLLLIVLALVYYNQRLSYLVRVRTKELEDSKQEAERATESKSAFLANMSHEIRTPMNAILGFVEQLEKNEKDPLRINMFATIKNSSDNLLTIINDILDISKIESGKIDLDIQASNVPQLFKDLEALFQQVCSEKNITYTFHLDTEVPLCAMIDKTRLMQVLINLVNNAIKFTHEGGEVKMLAAFAPKTQNIEIFVVDNGIGIASQNIDKIFNAFEQEDASTTRRFGGTGLGLSISKKLIVMMGGNITVTSTPNKGSIFYIRLPYQECETDLFMPDTPTQDTTEMTLEGKALIVEDNKTNQMLLSFILDDVGLKYEIADNGQEAVDMFLNNPEYDIILMDENMPVMNGIEAVNKIRKIEKKEQRKAVPIIAVTANALSGDRVRFIDAGMDDYIAKPYSEATIRKILQQYMS